ncbi:NAD(P)-binding protein [Leucogyrophana mollusca]|uniref:NAD(P)-binding protein n=1 Tax=Leucogyrophana mollusca TaxID=85980 RepID=A0ACB8BHX1_9AGAM|nr:NAD(P)-binding protein [Leucogyrophana mollusca]
MPKVLVIGASGFIGLPVAQALSRAGHTVYGLTRSESKAKQLAADEIIPIVGEPTNPQPWLNIVPTLDVVIEALGGSADLRTLSVALLKAVGEAAKTSRPASAPKISYIYTSGTWVHGESRNDFVSDTTPLLNPVKLVAWRPAVEQAILSDSTVNGIVIRPALLYGKTASLLSSLFEEAANGKVAWYGRPGGRFSLIHPDDLADIYVRAVEKAPILGGLAIDAGNEYTESVGDFLQKLVEVSGAKGPYELITPSNRTWDIYSPDCY